MVSKYCCKPESGQSSKMLQEVKVSFKLAGYFELQNKNIYQLCLCFQKYA